MAGDFDSNTYLKEIEPPLRSLAAAAHDCLIKLGCQSYVKTIYIGYDLDGEMVAALYARNDFVEIALALPEEAENPILVDASHLTWRTLPVAAVIRSADDLPSFTDLAIESVNRVKTASHNVLRDNEFFFGRRKERHSKKT
jgi:hypothetical protein